MPEGLLILRAHKIVHFFSDVSESLKLDVDPGFHEQYFPLLPARHLHHSHSHSIITRFSLLLLVLSGHPPGWRSTGLWEAGSTQGGSDADWHNAKPSECSPKGLVDICVIQNILSEFPSHSTDMIVKQLKHISALYEVLRIFFFQAQFSDISSIAFPEGWVKLSPLLLALTQWGQGLSLGGWAKSKVQIPVPIWLEAILNTTLEELAAALT